MPDYQQHIELIAFCKKWKIKSCFLFAVNDKKEIQGLRVGEDPMVTATETLIKKITMATTGLTEDSQTSYPNESL